MAAFDAICSAQKGSSTRRLEPYLSLPYLTLPSEGADEGAIACTHFVIFALRRHESARPAAAAGGYID